MQELLCQLSKGHTKAAMKAEPTKFCARAGKAAAARQVLLGWIQREERDEAGTKVKDTPDRGSRAGEGGHQLVRCRAKWPNKWGVRKVTAKDVRPYNE